MKEYKVLAINPGSTSTKIAVFLNEDLIMEKTLRHSTEEIQKYVESKEPMDKAGSYGIQGKAAVFIKGIEGDYYNVVGFPIARFLQEITK